MEIWKPLLRIPGYDISNLGKVRSSRQKKTKLLKIANNSTGYELVCLSRNGVRETNYIHRLVAEVFIPTVLDKNLSEVNHKDKNRKNNCVDNLEWTNYSNNQKHKLDPVRYTLYQELNALTELLTNDKLKTLIAYFQSNK
jgi:hypothetical protein